MKKNKEMNVPQKTFERMLQHAAAGYEVYQQLGGYDELVGEKITEELADALILLVKAFEENKIV